MCGEHSRQRGQHEQRPKNVRKYDMLVIFALNFGGKETESINRICIIFLSSEAVLGNIGKEFVSTIS